MKQKCYPAEQRLVEALKKLGVAASCYKLAEMTGVKSKNVSTRLARQISLGNVEVVMGESTGKQGPIPSLFHWVGDGTPEVSSALSARKPAQRKCLACGDMFDSSSAANRICPSCSDKQRYGSHQYGYFDQPVHIHYR